jgi:peptidoglycan/LPS O-acetylase OafA/YrhL
VAERAGDEMKDPQLPSDEAPRNPARNFGMDLIRATAISFVLLAHTFNSLEMLGVAGVELFFVLSGFLVGGVIIRMLEKRQKIDRNEIKNFLKRRFFRTLPNYYLFLFLYCILDQTFLANTDQPLQKIATYSFFLQNLAWPNPQGFFSHSWSLCTEEWFYLLIILTLFLTLKCTGHSAGGRRIALCLTAFFFIAGPIALRFAFGSRFDDIRMIVVFRLDAIMYGYLIALAQSFWPFIWNKYRWLLFFGLILNATGLMIYGQSSAADALALTLIPLGFAGLLPFFYRLRPTNTILDQMIERISILSYSIYLCHILIYFGLQGPLGYSNFNTIEKLAYKMAAILLIIVSSQLIYTFYEKPMTDLRDRFS